MLRSPLRALERLLHTGILQPVSRIHARAPAWCVALLMLAMCFVLFPRVFLFLEVIGPSDLIYHYSPWKYENPLGIVPGHYKLSDQMDDAFPGLIYTRDRMAEGVLPSFTDRVQNGIAEFWIIDQQHKVLPLMLLLLVLGVPVGWSAYLILKIVLGGVFFYKFLRVYELHPAAAVMASVVFSFASYPIQKLGIAVHLQYVLIPVVLYATERILRDRSLWWIALLPVLLHWSIVSGYPPGTAYGVTLFVAYGVFRLWQVPHRMRLAGIFLGLGAVSLLISLPALAASYDFLAHGFNTDYRTGYWSRSLPLENLPTYVVPFLHGHPLSGRTAINWVRHATYIGVLPILLVLASLVYGRFSPVRTFFLVFALWLVAVLYDLFGFLDAVYRHIPVLNAAMPDNQTQVHVLVLAVLFAFALHDVLSPGDGARKKIALLALVPAVLGFAYLIAAWVDWSQVNAFQRQHYIAQGVVIVLSLLLLVAALLRLLKPDLVAGLALVLVAADLLAMGADINRSNPRAAFYPATPGIHYLQEHIGTGKIMMLDKAFLENTPLAFDLPTIAGRGFFDTEKRRLYRLINDKAFRGRKKTAFYFPLSHDTDLLTQTIDALGVKYVVVPKGAKFSDLSFEYLVNLKAWNAIQPMHAGQSVDQTFRPDRSFVADQLEIRVGPRRLTNATQITATLTGPEGQIAIVTRRLDRMDSPVVTFPLPDVRFTANAVYTANFLVHPETKGRADFFYVRGLDYIQPGEATVGGQRLNGDLYFRLSKRHPVAARLAEKFRVVYDRDLTLWQNTRVFGRAWVVPNVELLNAEQAYDRMRRGTHDLAEWAWIDDGTQPPAELLRANGSPLSAGVDTIELAPTRQRFGVHSSRRALMVISDNFDPGWKATVDGEPVPLLKVNYLMRGVAVPRGFSTVELRYAPAFLTSSYWIAGFTVILFFGGVAAWSGFRRLRAGAAFRQGAA